MKTIKIGNITKSYSKVTVSEVGINDLTKDNQAQLRQTITKHYPGIRIGSDCEDALFDEADFGKEGSDYTEERVVFIRIPENATKEMVEAQLQKNPEATLYKKMSYNLLDILDDGQRFALDSDEYENVTEESLSNSYSVKDKEGNIILENNNPIFRQVFYSKIFREDVDMRVAAPVAEETPVMADARTA